MSNYYRKRSSQRHLGKKRIKSMGQKPANLSKSSSVPQDKEPIPIPPPNCESLGSGEFRRAEKKLGDI